MKSLLLLLPFLALTLHAAPSNDDAAVKNLNNRVSALEQRKNGGGVILPSAGPAISDDVGICFDAELLIWKAHQTGMNYAHGGSAVASTDPMKKINFRFDPGIRAQFGVRPKHDDWEFDAVWTHFYAKSSGSTSDSVFPNFYPPSATVSTSTSATWRLNMNVADLELSRATYISKWLSTRPYLSLRGAWIGQKYLINSNGVANSSSDMQSYLYSVGPRGGFDLKFGLGQGLYVFNDSSAAMLWGYFKNTQNTLGATSYYRNMNVHTTTFNVDMSLGLGWDRLVDEGRYRVSLRGSWDHSIYFDANYFASYPALATIDAFDTARGNLSLEGFTFAFRLDF